MDYTLKNKAWVVYGFRKLNDKNRVHHSYLSFLSGRGLYCLAQQFLYRTKSQGKKLKREDEFLAVYKLEEGLKEKLKLEDNNRYLSRPN